MRNQIIRWVALLVVASPFIALIGYGLLQAHNNARFPHSCYACSDDMDQ